MQIILTEEEYNALKGNRVTDEIRLKNLIEDYRVRVGRAFLDMIEAESPDAWAGGGRFISRETLSRCWNAVWAKIPVIDESRK
jgi:hypothetical protein